MSALPPGAAYAFAHKVLPRDVGGGAVTWGLVNGTGAAGYLELRFREAAGESTPVPPELAWHPVMALGPADVRMVTLPTPLEATHGYFAAFVREASGSLRYFVLEKSDLGEPVLGEWRVEGSTTLHVNHGPASEGAVSAAQRSALPAPHAAAFVVAITKAVLASPTTSLAAQAPKAAQGPAQRPLATWNDRPLADHEIPDFRAGQSGGGGGGFAHVRLVLIGVKLVVLLLYAASRGHC